MMFSRVRLKFFTKLIIHNFYKKEEYRHLHGAVREYVINLKERPQVSMSHLDQLSMTLCSFFDLAPDSTITNTTSSENLDATEHPLFLIVNGHHNTMVYFSLNFQKSNETFIKHQKS
jgi:hypothetical protein